MRASSDGRLFVSRRFVYFEINISDEETLSILFALLGFTYFRIDAGRAGQLPGALRFYDRQRRHVLWSTTRGNG